MGQIEIKNLFDGVESMVMERANVAYIVLSSGIAVPVLDVEPMSRVSDSAIEKVEIFPASYLIRIHINTGEIIEMETSDPFSPPPVNGRPIIYLDQKDWSALARSEEQGCSDAIARTKTRLIERAIIAPLSFAHVAETSQWSVRRRRYSLAVTIGNYSRGWQMMYPTRVWIQELREIFSNHGTIETALPLDVISLAPGTAFPDEPKSLRIDSEASIDEVIQYLSDAATYPISYFDLMLSVDATKSNPVPQWAIERQQITDMIATDAPMKKTRSDRAKWAFVHDTLLYFVIAAQMVGMPKEDLLEWVKIDFDRDIRTMKALGYWYEVFRQKHLNTTTKWTQNDLIDLLYLSCAAGYVDVIVAERSAASFLTRAAIALGRHIDVFTSIEQLDAQYSF